MKRLLLLSGKGGTGKTTTAAAFLRFSGAGAAADCDVDAPNLHLILQPGEEPETAEFLGGEKAEIRPDLCVGCGLCRERCRFGAIMTEDGKCRVNAFACEGCGVCAYVCPRQAITLHKDVAGEKQLYRDDRVFSTARLKMGRGNSGKLVTEVKLSMLKAAPPDCELAITDGSPGIGCPVIASVSGMDLVLIVTEPTRSGISDLERLLKTAETFDVKAAVCVNKWDVSPENTQAIRACCEKCRVPFVGTIPYDKQASAAINKGKSLADLNGPAARALHEIYLRTMELMGVKAE